MCELHIKFSDGFPGGAVEPLCHDPGSQPQRRPNCHGFQCVCKFSRDFDHVKPPKNARIVKKTKKKNSKENNRIADFLLGGAHDKRCKSCSAR